MEMLQINVTPMPLQSGRNTMAHTEEIPRAQGFAAPPPMHITRK